MQGMHYLRVFIGQLRGKIERDPEDPKIIRTEPGADYPLCRGLTARLNIISHILSKIPYEGVPGPRIELPKRQRRPEGYKELDYPYKMVTETF